MNIKCNRCRCFKPEASFIARGSSFLSCDVCRAYERDYQRKRFMARQKAKPTSNNYWQNRNAEHHEAPPQFIECRCGAEVFPSRLERSATIRCSTCRAKRVETAMAKARDIRSSSRTDRVHNAIVASRSADRPGREPCLSVSSLNFPSAVSDDRGGIFPQGVAATP